MPYKSIIFFGRPMVLACDGKCEKAWGIQCRPRKKLDEHDVDDFSYLTDDELGIAPDNPGTYEGDHGKSPLSLNKWCARQCERSVMAPTLYEIKLRNFSKPFYNIPSKHEHATEN